MNAAKPPGSEAKLLFEALPRRGVEHGALRRHPPGRNSFIEPVHDWQSASVALLNLRGAAVALVLILHSSIAYLASVEAQGYAFDQPPFKWLAYPVLDRNRWLGFDILCAWLDVWLMPALFFLSGIFAWPSLMRYGERKFLVRRLARLGWPIVVGVLVIMPIALYPVYRASAASPTWAGYVRAYVSLPFVPVGPLWFLWVLLAFDALAAALHRYAPGLVRAAASTLEKLAARPRSAFAFASLLAIAAYAPFALRFTPWSWGAWGPVGIQLSRPLLYAFYFLAGFSAGANGLDQGLLKCSIWTRRGWRGLGATTALTLVIWLGLAGLAQKLGGHAPTSLEILSDAAYAVAGVASGLFALASAFRLASVPLPIIGAISEHSLGIYLVHYAPVLWLQDLLRPSPLPAVLKAAIVFLCALTVSFGVAAAARKGLEGRLAHLGRRLDDRGARFTAPLEDLPSPSGSEQLE